MTSLDLDHGLEVIVVGAGGAFLGGGGTGPVMSGRLAGQGAAQASARNHGV